MNSVQFAGAIRWRRVVGFAAAFLLLAFLRHATHAQGTDAGLHLAIAPANQNVVLTWFGSNAVAYQVEASTNLTAWTNASPVLTGNNAVVSVTNSNATAPRRFFRIKRFLPVDPLSAEFEPATGILTIIGNALDNIIVVNRDVSGAIRVNNGDVPIRGGVATVANTILIQIFGRAGNDQLSLNEVNGALPKAHLFGESGNDILIGGSGADLLDGGSGDDTLLGKGGADNLLGGDDNDVVTGGDADDTVQLGAGNDRFIWNPGDDTDLIEGNDGTDTVEVNGGNGAEVFTTTANGARVRFDRLSPAPFFLDIGTCENIVLKANGGDDSFSATGNLATLIHLTVDGGPGKDTILGSNGNDMLLGGDDNDFIDGNQGNDTIFMGAGDDVFQWDPGDGLDTIEGQSGNDTLLFNGSAIGETIDISALATRLRFTRNIGTIALDIAGVETLEFNALGGADIITVNDLSSTEINSLNLRLGGVFGGDTGDLSVDSVHLYGTAASDNITVTEVGTLVNIAGLKPAVTIVSAETNDVLTINAEAGNDTVNASGLFSLLRLSLDGGPGNDILTGSLRADTLLGGDDNDTITGLQGNDLVDGGAGDDTFVWNPGDGNDVLEGRSGTDQLLFNGSSIGESVDLSANLTRLRCFRDIDNVVLDGNQIEKVRVNLLGGADTIVVNELTPTDVKDVSVGLEATGGASDGQLDSVIFNGTQTNDTVLVSGSAGKVTVTGLSASLTIFGADPTIDRLTVNALAGADVVDATTLSTGVLNLILNGGLGNDRLLGSQGADLMTGGDGDDVVLGGGGDDTFVWNPGDDSDSLEGQGGTDTLLFNGANIAETIELSANGARLRFSRNIGTVVMDGGGIEKVRFNALGGADLITVNDLSGTGVTGVTLALSATLDSLTGDGQPDSIIINATGANDSVILSGSSVGVNVAGLPATVAITGSEALNDRLTLKLLAGDDVADASALFGGAILLTLDGGIDDDVLIGSAGIDTLLGDEGDDLLQGGPGADILDGGPGTNILLQD